LNACAQLKEMQAHIDRLSGELAGQQHEMQAESQKQLLQKASDTHTVIESIA
jgi:glutamine synthetase